MTRTVRPRTLRRIASRERQRGYLGLNSYRRLAASALSGPVFFSQLTTSIVPDHAAAGTTPTFTRATTKTFTDWEGVVRTAQSGEACFTGARRVRNLVANTDMTSGSWSQVSVTVAAGAADPTGGTGAYTATAAGANVDLYNGTTTNGSTHTSSLWIRRRTGSGTVFLIDAAANRVAVAVSAVWQRFSAPGLATVVGGTTYVGVRIGTSGDAVDLWQPQKEDVTGQSNPNPSEWTDPAINYGAGVVGVQYFATQNGNTVASNVVTAGTGAAIPLTTLLGYDAWQAATNLALQSTFAATWTVSNATLTANAAVGPDGTSTAATLTEAAATSTHVTLQSFTKAASALAYTMTVWAKAGLRSQIGIALDNGSASAGIVCFFNLSNGTPGTPGAGGTYVTTLFTGASVSMTAFPNGWYRCRLTATTDTGTTLRVQIMPSDGGGTLSYVGTAGSGVSIFGAQVEQNAFATPYIATTTAAVTRNADVLTYPSSGNVNTAAGAAYAEVTLATLGTGDPRIVGSSSTDAPILYNAGTSNPRIYDQTTYASSGLAALVANTTPKLAGGWGGSAMKAVKDGVLGSSQAFDGSILTGVNIELMQGGGTGAANGNIRNVKIWTRALTDAQLQALTT